MTSEYLTKGGEPYCVVEPDYLAALRMHRRSEDSGLALPNCEQVAMKPLWEQCWNGMRDTAIALLSGYGGATWSSSRHVGGRHLKPILVLRGPHPSGAGNVKDDAVWSTIFDFVIAMPRVCH